jgi:hypothetical protein
MTDLSLLPRLPMRSILRSVRTEQHEFIESHMRRLSPFGLLFIALLGFNGCGTKKDGSSSAVGPSANERGAQIVSEYLRRDASPYRQVELRITVSSTNEPDHVYKLKVSRKQTAAETLTLTEIEEPAAERNASLTIEQKGQDAINVTYASALGRFRETGTGKMFFGGVTAQEFLGEWDKYDYRLIGEKEVDPVKAYEVEAVLKPGRDSIIARFTTDFRSDTYLPAESHLFNSDREELRRFQVKDYRNFAGRPFVGRTEIENFINKTKLTVEALNVTFPDKMDDSIFSREHLKKSSQS